MAHSTKSRPLFERMDEKTTRGNSESSCWVWDGSRSAGGYGYVWLSGRMRLVHRLSYERYVGPIADGIQLDHLCRNRACLNPRHLDAVTPKVNYLRGVGLPAINARLTHCRRGHAFDEANTRIEGDGSRRCLACRTENRRARGR